MAGALALGRVRRRGVCGDPRRPAAARRRPPFAVVAGLRTGRCADRGNGVRDRTGGHRGAIARAGDDRPRPRRWTAWPGAVLTACVGLGITWVLGALALANGGEARREVQRSTILRQLNTWLPPSSGLIEALARLDPFPRIDGPEANVPAPTASIARADGVRAAADSVVKILGNACGLGVEGSGWVAGERARGDERARGRGAGGHAGAAPRAPARAGRGRRVVRLAQRPRRAARRRACRAGADAGARIRSRARRRRSSASRATGRTTSARGAWGRRAR